MELKHDIPMLPSSTSLAFNRTAYGIETTYYARLYALCTLLLIAPLMELKLIS